MPRTNEHVLPYRAVAILVNADSVSCSCSDEHQAARFFDHVAMRYGYDRVVATYVDSEETLP
jgi:hypothetical protein